VCGIVGYIPMAGTTDAVGALLLAVAEGGKLVFAGRVGTGRALMRLAARMKQSL